MKTIITDDEGVRAARLACPKTAEVTEIDSKGLAALVLRGVRLGAEGLDIVSDALQKVAPDVLILEIPSGDAIEALDEKLMRQYGWVRAKK